MNALKENLFWIICGAIVVLVGADYFVAERSVQEKVKIRASQINSTFSSAQQLAGSEIKSEENIKHWLGLQGAAQAEVDAIKQFALQRQQSVLQWPAEVADKIPADPAKEIDRTTRVKYKFIYLDQVRRVYEVVLPTMLLGRQGRVVLGPGVFKPRDWSDSVPTSESIRDAQEDLWILGVLFNRIRAVNQKSESIQDSPIKEIVRIAIATPDAVDERSQVERVGSSSGIGTTGRFYLEDNEEYRLIPVHLQVKIEEVKIPSFLAHLTAGKLIVIPTQWQLGQAGASSFSSGMGEEAEEFEPSSPAAGPGGRKTSAELALFDVYAKMYMFKSPPVPETAVEEGGEAAEETTGEVVSE